MQQKRTEGISGVGQVSNPGAVVGDLVVVQQQASTQQSSCCDQGGCEDDKSEEGMAAKLHLEARGEGCELQGIGQVGPGRAQGPGLLAQPFQGLCAPCCCSNSKRAR